MLHVLIWLLAGGPCLLVSWVAGSYLLSLGRPQSTAELITWVNVLAVAVYGLALAFAPVCADGAPLALTLGWRLSLAALAWLFYDRLFGWRRLLEHFGGVVHTWRCWVRHYVDLGCAAGRHERQRGVE